MMVPMALIVQVYHAGNKISDKEFYGIAPGANVIGLKLGNNNYSGGATVAESMKKAYLYADQVSKEREGTMYN